MSRVPGRMAARAAFLIVVSVLVMSGCVTADPGSDTAPTQTATLEDPGEVGGGDVATDSVDSAEADLELLLGSVRGYTQNWNEAAADFVRNYVNESVDAETFVSEAEDQLFAMGAAQGGMESLATRVQDPALGRWMDELAQAYDAKLAASQALVDAVQDGAAEDEQAAQADLSRAVTDALALVDKLPRALRNLAPKSDRAELASELEQLLGAASDVAGVSLRESWAGLSEAYQQEFCAAYRESPEGMWLGMQSNLQGDDPASEARRRILTREVYHDFFGAIC